MSGNYLKCTSTWVCFTKWNEINLLYLDIQKRVYNKDGISSINIRVLGHTWIFKTSWSMAGSLFSVVFDTLFLLY